MESNEFCGPKLPFNEGKIKKKDWWIFHKVFLTEFSEDESFQILLNYLQNAEKQVAMWTHDQEPSWFPNFEFTYI